MTSPLGFGVIGCGDIAIRQHLPALVANRGARLVAVCDADEDRARHAAEQFGAARVYPDHRALLEDKEIGAVIIATQPWVTPLLAGEALRAGKDVLAEKPMALSVAEAEQLAQTERESGRLVQIGFTYRHGPLMDALRGWIAGGRLGSPLLLRLGVWDETWAPVTDPGHYERLMAVLRHGPPCVHDGAHSADHLNFLTASQAVRITAHGLKSRPEFPAPNYNAARIEFENGDSATLEIGWFYPHFPTSTFEVLGPNGLAWFDRDAQEAVLQIGDTTERVQLETDWVDSCFAVQLEKFLASVAARTTPVPGTREGIASLRLTKAFEQAMTSGETVILPAEQTP